MSVHSHMGVACVTQYYRERFVGASACSWVHSCSEEDEDLLDVTFNVLDFLADDVEADGLGNGAALSDGHDITGAEAEGGGAVRSHGLVALLETVVLADVVEVVTADDNGVLHLGGDNDTPKLS